jgi:hypothetical protein
MVVKLPVENPQSRMITIPFVALYDSYRRQQLGHLPSRLVRNP